MIMTGCTGELQPAAKCRQESVNVLALHPQCKGNRDALSSRIYLRIPAQWIGMVLVQDFLYVCKHDRLESAACGTALASSPVAM